MGQLNQNIYKGNMIFHRMMVSPQEYVRKSTNDMKNELKFLQPYEASIITKFRTECINLNGYKYFRFKDINNGHLGNCKCCHVPETVEHYLIDCSGQTNVSAERMNPFDTNYNANRNILKSRLKKIDSYFKNQAHFNVISLLFPHSWQQKPLKSDEFYKSKLARALNQRVFIIKEIIEYVHKTKRFKREKYGI